MNDKEYLNDSEYVEILNKIKDIIETPNFHSEYFDDTATGFKKTWSNCGFCNDTLVTKHRKENHRCPFDMGKETMPKGNLFIDYATGCFYRCYLFQFRFYDGSGSSRIEKMKIMVRDRLTEVIKL